jgi:hypothetical protein
MDSTMDWSLICGISDRNYHPMFLVLETSSREDHDRLAIRPGCRVRFGDIDTIADLV